MKKNYFILFILVSLNFMSFQLKAQGSYPFTYNGKNYEIIKEKMSWGDAAQYAVNKGGYLTHIETKNEQIAIYNAIKASNISVTYTIVNDGGGIAYIWIGATDKKTEGTWIWDGDNDDTGTNFWNGQGVAGSGNGSLVSGAYTNWGGISNSVYNEPDDFLKQQDAAAIGLEAWPKGMGSYGSAGEWNDINPSNTIYFIIEYDEKIDIPNLLLPGNDSKEVDIKPLFTWKKANADSYDFQLSKSATFQQVLISNTISNDTTFTPNTNLELGTKYYWRLRVTKGTNKGAWSSVFAFTTKMPLVPDVPTLVSPENNAMKHTLMPKFLWNKVKADTFQLQLSTYDDFSSELLINTKLTDSSFNVTDKLEKNTKYFWRVKGIIGKTSSNWSEVRTFNTLNIPSKPVLLSPADNTTNIDILPSFKFEIDNEVIDYKLIISKKNDLTSPYYTKVFKANGINSFTIDKELEYNTEYFWTISAINEAGESQNNTIRKFKTKIFTNIEELNNYSLSVFPLPATNYIEIQINSSNDILNESNGVEIYNESGEIVLRTNYTINNNSAKVDISILNNGVYFAKAGNYFIKFIKI